MQDSRMKNKKEVKIVNDKSVNYTFLKDKLSEINYEDNNSNERNKTDQPITKKFHNKKLRLHNKGRTGGGLSQHTHL